MGKIYKEIDSYSELYKNLNFSRSACFLIYDYYKSRKEDYIMVPELENLKWTEYGDLRKREEYKELIGNKEFIQKGPILLIKEED